MFFRNTIIIGLVLLLIFYQVISQLNYYLYLKYKKLFIFSWK